MLRVSLGMKSICHWPHALVYLTSIMLLFVGYGCSRSNEGTNEMNRADIESKLNVVLQEIVSRCDDAMDKEALRAAKLFQKLQNLDVVGFSVPINSGSNHVHVSFTLDHFQQTPPDVLATEGLEDFQTAKASSRRGPNG